MTEQKTTKENEEALPKVGDMDVNTFFSVMCQVLDRKREAGDDKLMDMKVGDFTDLVGKLMLDQYKSRAFATAQAETDVAERILTDWKGLGEIGAVTQPFRLRTKEEATKFYQDLQAVFGPSFRGELVVAVAIVNPNGTYERKTFP